MALLLLALACAPPPLAWTPAPPPAFSPDKQRVEVVFAGDVSVARGIRGAIEKWGGGDPAWPLRELAPTFAAADLVFANLECVLADSDEGKTDKLYAIRAEPKYAAGLKTSGLDVVSVANNHAMDFSHAGFFSTLRETAKLGLLTPGVLGEQGQDPVVVQVGALTMGFLAFNAHGDEARHRDWRPRAALYDVDEAVAAVRALRPRVDQLVVSMHWGPELSHLPWDWQIEDAHALVDAGADFVIGHHPHVAQPVEVYRGKVIAYSLGDLLFDKQAPWLRTRTGPRFMLVASFEGKAFTGFRLAPIQHDKRYTPAIVPAQDTASFLVGKAPAAWRASDAVESAHVSRDGVPCDDFRARRPRLPGGWLRWLGRRWTCPDDETQPGDAVGKSAELSATALRTGIWASPSDVVVLRFDDVPFGAELDLLAGFSDWVLVNEASAKPAERSAVTVEVRAVAAGVDVHHTLTVPFVEGWREVAVDTRALADKRGTLELRVVGKRRSAPGFLVDASVPLR